MNTHMGSIHGKNISFSGSWKDNASSSSSLCAAHDKIEIDCDIYSDVCDSISQSKRRTRESHEGNACKDTTHSAGRRDSWVVLKKRVSDTCTRVDLL